MCGAQVYKSGDHGLDDKPWVGVLGPMVGGQKWLLTIHTTEKSGCYTVPVRLFNREAVEWLGKLAYAWLTLPGGSQ